MRAVAPGQDRVAELFGEPTDRERGAAEWRATVAAQDCPYTSKRCFKVRKSDPDTSIGTCVVRAGTELKPLIICPNRLLAGGRVFEDVLPLLSRHEPGNQLHLIPEVGTPGGNIDYFLASTKEGRPVDFVGIEFQTLDTTGSVWPSRQEFLARVGALDPADAPPAKPFGINWKMTAKTILVQLHHKIETFEALDRKLVLVLQQELMDYMAREFSFSHLAAGSPADSLHFHPYSLGEDLALTLGTPKSTDAEGIAAALNLGEKDALDLETLNRRLEEKLSEATAWEPVADEAPPPLTDVSDD